jgi:geranylgeranyl diphosphate synthase type II
VTDGAAGLDARLDVWRRAIAADLASVLPVPPDAPSRVVDAMGYSLAAGGKRLRPLLCLAAADAVGGDVALARPAACALELIHTYSLIHDDLPAMDDDTLRRGRPTLHTVVGDGQAILAGDGLLTEAFSLLARAPRDDAPELAARRLRTIAVIAEAAGARGMVGGQAVDLACVRPDPEGRVAAPLDAEGLRDMHARKTGALIRAAAVAGAVMGGAPEAAIDAVARAGAEFGLAFQIVDDILDVEGASATLGKTAGKDAAAGKPTYPARYGVDESRRLAGACLTRAADALAGAAVDAGALAVIGRWIVDRSA